jgi:hypothetical protein
MGTFIVVATITGQCHAIQWPEPVPLPTGLEYRVTRAGLKNVVARYLFRVAVALV